MRGWLDKSLSKQYAEILAVRKFFYVAHKCKLEFCWCKWPRYMNVIMDKNNNGRDHEAWHDDEEEVKINKSLFVENLR